MKFYNRHVHSTRFPDSDPPPVVIIIYRITSIFFNFGFLLLPEFRFNARSKQNQFTAYLLHIETKLMRIIERRDTKNDV